MKKVLFIYPAESTFVRKDIEILSEKYIVAPYHIVFRKSAPGFIVDFLLYSVRLLIRLLKTDYVYIWFADYHSLLPSFLGKIFRKKVIIVLGGYDIARIKKYRYGALLKNFRGWCVKRSVSSSFINLPVSKYVARKAKYIFPKGDFHIVNNAFDDQSDASEILVGIDVITVAKLSRERDIFIKGIDKFIDVARRIPETQFSIVGAEYDISTVVNDIPDNVTVFGLMAPRDLRIKLNHSNVYCQFSVIESFGLAVIEAISCGCVPVVSKAGALPEISGEYGFIVSSVEDAIRSIKLAQDIDLETREKSVLCVKDRFSVERRRKALFSIIEA